jgi:hypothetical protein
MNNVIEPIVTISLAIVGLATLAVLVSRNANTAGVLTAYGQTFSSMVAAATAPVTGNAANPSAFNTSLLSGFSPYGYAL